MTGFTNFDARLTTDRAAEEAERRVEAQVDAWEEYCEKQNLDLGIADPDHPEHEVYQEWATAWESSFDEYE